MREELWVTVQRFYGHIRVKVGLVMGFLLLIASALLAAIGYPTPAWASLLIGLVTLVLSSFWAYHLLRVQHEAGYIDPRIEVLAEAQGRYPGTPNRRGVFVRRSAEGDARLAAINSTLSDGVIIKIRMRDSVDGILRVSYSLPVYSSYAMIENSGGHRTVDGIRRHRQSVIISEVLAYGSILSVTATAPAPITVRRVEIIKPPTAVPPDATATE